jgi:hypothetical protein
MATPGIGLSTQPTIKELKSFASMVFDNIGVGYGPHKINNLATRFARTMPNANGWTFFLYLVNAVQITAEQQRRGLANPDIARVISYSDPTGEAAVHRALRPDCECERCVAFSEYEEQRTGGGNVIT